MDFERALSLLYVDFCLYIAYAIGSSIAVVTVLCIQHANTTTTRPYLALRNHPLVHGRIPRNALGQGPHTPLPDQVAELRGAQHLAGQRRRGCWGHRVLDTGGFQQGRQPDGSSLTTFTMPVARRSSMRRGRRRKRSGTTVKETPTSLTFEVRPSIFWKKHLG